MVKTLTFILLVFIFFIFSSSCPKAKVNPLDYPNNKFGIHISDEYDFLDAYKLVNSSGGDYGYVTLVIREDERDISRWKNAFDELRKLHLIPIVRIASKQAENYWFKPSISEIDNWISFLNSLNWIVENRYIVIGNEPNHSKEWGGKLNPAEYAQYFLAFAKKAKASNHDYFVMMAGFDASAPSDSKHMDEELFIKKMYEYDKTIFNHIDGWVSHSYPSEISAYFPDSPTRGSEATYLWELDLLKELGVSHQLPVFITETGWIHNKTITAKDEKILISKIDYAFTKIWSDKNVVAVTPFILNYQSKPFDAFSWKKINNTFYAHYYFLQNISKEKGNPKQIASAKFMTIIFPAVFPNRGKKYGIAYAQNTGQTIWQKFVNIKILVSNDLIEIKPLSFTQYILPGSSSIVFYKK